MIPYRNPESYVKSDFSTLMNGEPQSYRCSGSQQSDRTVAVDYHCRCCAVLPELFVVAPPLVPLNKRLDL